MATHSPLQSSRAPVTLFVVDDDEIDRETILRSVEERGLNNPVRVARDGEEALEILKGQGGEPIRTPYLMLLDLNMPRMNGIELLQEIRRDPDLNRAVVFVLTTSNAETDRMAAYNLNVAGYILKAKAGLEFERVVELIDQFERSVEFPN